MGKKKGLVIMALIVVLLLVSAVGYEVYSRAHGGKEELEQRTEIITKESVSESNSNSNENSLMNEESMVSENPSAIDSEASEYFAPYDPYVFMGFSEDFDFYSDPNDKYAKEDKDLFDAIVSNIGNEDIKNGLINDYGYKGVFGWTSSDEGKRLCMINLQDVDLVVEELDVTDLPLLRMLVIPDNRVKKLIVNSCESLRLINVRSNQMKELYITDLCSAEILCANNQFTEETKERLIDDMNLNLLDADFAREEAAVLSDAKYSQVELDALEKIAKVNLGINFDRNKPESFEGVTWCQETTGEAYVEKLLFPQRDVKGTLDLREFQHISEVCCAETGIEGVYLPEGLKKISIQGFYSCPNLKEVVLPESITLIEKGGFAHSNNLEKVTILSNNVVISGGAFYNISEDAIIYHKKGAKISYSEDTFMDTPKLDVID